MKKKMLWCLACLAALGLAGCRQQVKPAREPAVSAIQVKAEENTADEAATAEQAGAEDAGKEMSEEETRQMIEQLLAQANASAVPAPDDVAAPPEDALKTATGLAYKKLTANESGTPVTDNAIVRLHYTGWTTDGKMFDTSTRSSKPATFVTGQLIPGMKEALKLAKTGEKIRVWIPEELAYKDHPEAPQGMLVFEFDVQDVTVPTAPQKEPPADAVRLDNGIVYKITETSEGAAALSENSFVTLDFSGWSLEDGMLFQSTFGSDDPKISAPVNAMFPGWRSVLPHAHVGDTVQIWVPQQLGIDPTGSQLKGTLGFELKVTAATDLPTTPDDVAAPPADASKTESGLASKVLTPGSGTEHPTAESVVSVNYSGWTTDGAMFDSSIPSGRPIEFALNQVIAGWTEGLQLMVKGEKRRFWIPEELAYKGAEGAPKGMLVFDVELLDIKNPAAAPAEAPVQLDVTSADAAAE